MHARPPTRDALHEPWTVLQGPVFPVGTLASEPLEFAVSGGSMVKHLPHVLRAFLRFVRRLAYDVAVSGIVTGILIYFFK